MRFCGSFTMFHRFAIYIYTMYLIVFKYTYFYEYSSGIFPNIFNLHLAKKNDVHDLDRRLQLDSCDAHSLHFNAPAG